MKSIYYSLYEAERAACVYAEKHGGRVVGLDLEIWPVRGTITDRDAVDFEDARFTRKVGQWSGELAAVRVVDADTLEDLALFGYWEDED